MRRRSFLRAAVGMAAAAAGAAKVAEQAEAHSFDTTPHIKAHYTKAELDALPSYDHSLPWDSSVGHEHIVGEDVVYMRYKWSAENVRDIFERIPQGRATGLSFDELLTAYRAMEANRKATQMVTWTLERDHAERLLASGMSERVFGNAIFIGQYGADGRFHLQAIDKDTGGLPRDEDAKRMRDFMARFLFKWTRTINPKPSGDLVDW